MPERLRLRLGRRPTRPANLVALRTVPGRAHRYDCARSRVSILERVDESTLTLADLAACRPDKAELSKATNRLHAKAWGIAALAIVSYLGLVFVATGPLTAIPLAAVLVVAIIAIGTSVMHDANHGAFGTSRRVASSLMFTADLVGASSWLWRQKHNVMHHGNTNVVGMDSDIEQMPFARLAPAQPWKPWHRFQHVYMWGLYGFLTAEWVLMSDFASVIARRRGKYPDSRHMNGRDIASMLLGKVVHVGWAVALPVVFHRWWVVLAFYFACSWMVGFVLAIFFQLAHCVDTTEFAEAATPRRGDDFVNHQLRTTANIRCTTPVIGPFVSWLMGGLHHQIEHHLAPGLPHTSYPAMSKRVRELCAERGINYRVHTNFWTALRSHARWLHTMGRRPVAEPAASSR
jgi:linoleoyl-CoA desaturase